MAKPAKVLLDLNNPIFQDDLLGLRQEDANRVLATLRKLKQLSWNEVYRDKGLRWELVQVSFVISPTIHFLKPLRGEGISGKI